MRAKATSCSSRARREASVEPLALAVANGRLVIPIAKKLPLSDAREAQTLAEKGAGGKVILTG